MLKKISQMEKNTYCKITLICGIEKHQTNKSKTDSLDTENTLVVARGQQVPSPEKIGSCRPKNDQKGRHVQFLPQSSSQAPFCPSPSY